MVTGTDPGSPRQETRFSEVGSTSPTLSPPLRAWEMHPKELEEAV